MLIRLVRRHLAPHRAAVIAIVVLQLLQTLATLYLPTLNADIIDDGVVRADLGVIWSVGGLMLLMTVGQILCNIAAILLAARVAMSVGRQVRAEVFAAVQRFSSREVTRFGAPSLITRSTNDVQQVQMIVLMSFTMLVTAPIMGVGGVVLALQQDVALSGLLLVVLPVLIVVIGLIVRRLVPLFRRGQTQLDRVNAVLREQIMGLSVIRAFVRERQEADRFDAANRDLTGTQLASGYLLALMFPSIMLVVNVATVGVLWFGAMRIDAGQMQIGALTAFLAYIMQILMAVMLAMFLFMMLPRAAVSAERITEVLDAEPSVVSAPGAVDAATLVARRNGTTPAGEHTEPPARLTGALRFDHVGFRYPGAQRDVLRDITFTAAPGRTTAIIGSTGAGKTTLLNLVPRLLDATAGTVTIGGHDITGLTLDSLRAGIGLVPQRAHLFSGSVASNLRMADPEATDEQLWAALRVAQAADFVAALPDGLGAAVEPGGTNLSGGQRQRLCIARALVRRPGVYLFDDSFSALDYATDARVRSALVPWTRDAVVVVVAQRVSTIRHADTILVLDEGALVGTGTHEDLLADCPTYREIVESQLSAEEAA
ncbi:multidrug ABC transporter ATP-binding protein [Tersicoccus solisilvae]|uniref:Multidrug ABC transporter ATP-binding protein n=1 Tax=Tersicoccus solisilvae TaxID=1882339 RepID=A0ABQ1P0H5_9MICC|nr:ABC transporter ATP-binding protein [Tersicoccus solisilvae]GGC88644.1 multidrug ABC transporter ATP-binding protein [Tersicoccus solisilvae]